MTTTRIDMVRKMTNKKTESLYVPVNGDDQQMVSLEIPVEEADPQRLVVDPMLSESVEEALLSLPENYRMVIILADMEQIDYSEVSRILGIPIGTVRSRLHRARALLRTALVL